MRAAKVFRIFRTELRSVFRGSSLTFSNGAFEGGCKTYTGVLGIITYRAWEVEDPESSNLSVTQQYSTLPRPHGETSCDPPPCLRSPHVSSSRSKIHVSASLPYRTQQTSPPRALGPRKSNSSGHPTDRARGRGSGRKPKAKKEENQRIQTPWAERRGMKRTQPVQRCNPSPEPRTRSDSVFAGVCTSERVQGRSYTGARTPISQQGREIGGGRAHRAGERAHTRE